MKTINKIRRLIFTITLLLPAQSAFGQSPALDKFVDSHAKKHDFSGTILIQRNSKIVYARGFGLASPASHIKSNHYL